MLNNRRVGGVRSRLTQLGVLAVIVTISFILLSKYTTVEWNKKKADERRAQVPSLSCPPVPPAKECPAPTPCKCPPPIKCPEIEEKPQNCNDDAPNKTETYPPNITNVESAKPEKIEVRFTLNDDRTKTFVWPMAPLDRTDALGLAASFFDLTENFAQLRLWTKNGTEIKSQADYVAHVRSTTMATPQELFITVGEEKYRPINGVFMYLFTEGKHNVENYMIDSMESVERNFNSKFGDYPIIIFHAVSKETIERVMTRVKPKTRVYWVPVKQLHEARLPDIPVFENKTFTKGIGTCAGIVWDPSYLLMVRFRSVTMWRLPILQYFDYIVSIDADAAIVHSEIDFFKQISENDKIIGYLHCNPDSACTQGMWEYAETYMKQKNIQSEAWSSLARDVSYSGGFLVFQSKFFTSHPGVQELFDYYDTSGNILFKRWAEQSLFAIAVAMYAPKGKAYYIGGDLDVTHHKVSFPRHPACPGASKPDCCDFQ